MAIVMAGVALYYRSDSRTERRLEGP
jgi:hypothetical protein